MKKYYSIILILVTLIAFSNCKNEHTTKKYYIISKQDSINNVLLNGKGDPSLPPPRPPAPTPYKWYSNVVFIMDSLDKVYIYQTERSFPAITENRTTARVIFTAPIAGEQKEFKQKERSSEIFDFDYPNYIGLRPEHLITIDSKYFVSFLQSNSDIFQVDTNKVSSNIVIFIASEKDTIINEAFYNLVKFVTTKDIRLNGIPYFVRHTTEEENKVIYYKRKNKEFNPEKINWTTKFINGKFKPFTKEYDCVEKLICPVIKSKVTFEKGSMKIIPLK